MSFRIGSYELFAQRDSAYSIFEVDYTKDTQHDRTVWALGMRFVISRVGPRFPRVKGA